MIRLLYSYQVPTTAFMQVIVEQMVFNLFRVELSLTCLSKRLCTNHENLSVVSSLGLWCVTICNTEWHCEELLKHDLPGVNHTAITATLMKMYIVPNHGCISCTFICNVLMK